MIISNIILKNAQTTIPIILGVNKRKIYVLQFKLLITYAGNDLKPKKIKIFAFFFFEKKKERIKQVLEYSKCLFWL